MADRPALHPRSPRAEAPTHGHVGTSPLHRDWTSGAHGLLAVPSSARWSSAPHRTPTSRSGHCVCYCKGSATRTARCASRAPRCRSGPEHPVISSAADTGACGSLIALQPGQHGQEAADGIGGLQHFGLGQAAMGHQVLCLSPTAISLARRGHPTAERDGWVEVARCSSRFVMLVSRRKKSCLLAFGLALKGSGEREGWDPKPFRLARRAACQRDKLHLRRVGT